MTDGRLSNEELVAGLRGILQYGSRELVSSADAFLLREAADALATLQREADEMREALASAHAWLGRWAVHAGNCAGGMSCTCGLLTITTEAEIALIRATPLPPQQDAAEVSSQEKK
jgi:hypothetical protein